MNTLPKVYRYTGLLIAITLIFMWGCAGPLTMNKIQFVEIGIYSSKLSSMVGQKPSKVFTVNNPEDGVEYQVQIFPMQTGTATTYSSIYVEGTYIPISTSYPVSEDYAFLFREDSLLFWGFLHEYARSDDELIRRLAPIIMEGLKRREDNETE